MAGNPFLRRRQVLRDKKGASGFSDLENRLPRWEEYHGLDTMIDTIKKEVNYNGAGDFRVKNGWLTIGIAKSPEVVSERLMIAAGDFGVTAGLELSGVIALGFQPTSSFEDEGSELSAAYYCTLIFAIIILVTIVTLTMAVNKQVANCVRHADYYRFLIMAHRIPGILSTLLGTAHVVLAADIVVAAASRHHTNSSEFISIAATTFGAWVLGAIVIFKMDGQTNKQAHVMSWVNGSTTLVDQGQDDSFDLRVPMRRLEYLAEYARQMREEAHRDDELDVQAEFCGF
jgi:hypothetical protein